MAWKLYDYVDARGTNHVALWTRTLDRRQIGRLNQKLDMLEQHGPDLPPALLSDSSVSGIKKLKVHGNVQLRPHLCAGPINRSHEFTLLVGAKEKDWKLDPSNAGEIAEKRRNEIVTDPTRRVPHERVIPKPKK